jgi:PST family polysaccharide transporter
LIGFAATLAMTRLLSPDVFGFFSMALFWSALLNLRPKVGLYYAAIGQPHTDGALLGSYWGLDLAAAAGSLGLSVLAAGALSQLGYTNEVVVALVVLTSADSISALVSPLSMVLEKELQLSRLTLVSLLAAIVAYAVAVLLALAGAGLWSLLVINVIINLISLVGVVWVCSRRWPQVLQLRWRFDRRLAGRLLRRGLPSGLSLTALSSIVTQFDNFLSGTFVGYATLGFYDRAYRIAHWPNVLLTTIVSRVGFLTFAKVHGDLPRLTHAVRLSLWVLSTLGMPMAIVLFFGAPDIVGMLYGARWSRSADFLRFLTIYALLWPYVSMGLWLSIALQHGQATLMLAAAPALSLIVLATPLTIALGVSGTLIGVGATMLIAFALSCRYIFDRVPLAFSETFLIHVAALGMAVLVTAAMMRIAAWGQFVALTRLLLIIVSGPGTFFATQFVLRPAEMTERLRYLRRAFLVTDAPAGVVAARARSPFGGKT